MACTSTMRLIMFCSLVLGRDELVLEARGTSPQVRSCVCFIHSQFSKRFATVNPKLHKYVLKMKRMQGEYLPKNMKTI